jgi:hypothetical protein
VLIKSSRGYSVRRASAEKEHGNASQKSDQWLRALRDTNAHLGVQILQAPEMPTWRVLVLLTEDGTLVLGVTAESAQGIADMLAKAASEMRSMS